MDTEAFIIDSPGSEANGITVSAYIHVFCFFLHLCSAPGLATLSGSYHGDQDSGGKEQRSIYKRVRLHRFSTIVPVVLVSIRCQSFLLSRQIGSSIAMPT